jgi:hypothetical protein
VSGTPSRSGIVFVEALPENGQPVETDNPGAVEERRRPRGQRRADGGAEDRRQAIVAAQSPSDIERAYVNVWLDGQEFGPVDPAERLPEIMDARRVQIRDAVAAGVKADHHVLPLIVWASVRTVPSARPTWMPPA